MCLLHGLIEGSSCVCSVTAILLPFPSCGGSCAAQRLHPHTALSFFVSSSGGEEKEDLEGKKKKQNKNNSENNDRVSEKDAEISVKH